MKLKIKVSNLLGKYKKSQKWLCDKTGIRPATIKNYYYETIKRINIEDLENIFEAFYEIDNNLKIEDLFDILDS
ncbi:alkaline phosphatase [Clostridium tepidum]|uniref:Alkaline phosphatase n=1 Tax=Clostridium tepidum TaxID=1962263 RepID=A0A1S9I2C2_9CLOT|nr:helix-turn-helix transcriptional regulator [Clostridium tepidum]OOO64292.1 alkaline phosphatase [Clostridium tepidum]